MVFYCITHINTHTLCLLSHGLTIQCSLFCSNSVQSPIWLKCFGANHIHILTEHRIPKDELSHFSCGEHHADCQIVGCLINNNQQKPWTGWNIHLERSTQTCVGFITIFLPMKSSEKCIVYWKTLRALCLEHWKQFAHMHGSCLQARHKQTQHKHQNVVCIWKTTNKHAAAKNRCGRCFEIYCYS